MFVNIKKAIYEKKQHNQLATKIHGQKFDFELHVHI